MRSRRTVAAALLGAMVLAGTAGAWPGGGPIERACNKVERAAATPQMCDCIQRVADAVLKRGDQRLAARFFDDPHRAQEVRQSDRARDASFWQRYKYFGAAAELNCG